MSNNSLNTINYFELPSDNIEQLKGFYSSIFNWEFEKGMTNLTTGISKTPE